MAISQLSGVGNVGQLAPASKTPSREPARTPPPESSAPPKPSPEQVRQALQEIQRVVEPVAQNLQFMVDKETGKTVVRVVDATTQEVIRQIPTEEVLSIAKAIDRLQGLLLRQKA